MVLRSLGGRSGTVVTLLNNRSSSNSGLNMTASLYEQLEDVDDAMKGADMLKMMDGDGGWRFGEVEVR